MNFRIAGVIGIAFLLCACSDEDVSHALTYDTGPSPQQESMQSADATPAYAPPASIVQNALPATTEPQPSYSVTQTVTTITPIAPPDRTAGYCQTVAQGTGASATRDGMDGPAQQQAADTTYRQCMTLYGASGR